MSRPIDDRIVRMRLENSDFKSKVTQTVGIFGKLVGSMSKVKDVDLSKSAKDMNNINDAAKQTKMDKLVDGVTNVSSKFSALGIVAITALQNITNRVVDAGLQMAKSFTVKPIMDGFSEYELKMKSIQTIMSNTQGKSSLQDVTGVLDELNVYADKTIYNFAEMTKNIGTFTAAGVGLNDSAIAIKGIANLAAASGSNSEQASTAMYQLSQALSTGSVKLQDWNSVVNAGMGGKLFQDALLKTADNMGIANSGAENFRESLQEGWLSTEVLLATLKEFSEDQSMLDAATKVRTFTQLVDTAGEAVGSGWAQTWEIVFGNFEEAGVMWTNANNAISGPIEASSNARNKILQDLVNLGARVSVINSVSNAFKALMQMVGLVQKAFHEVFPPVTAEMLMKLIKNVEIFSNKLLLNEETANKVKEVFKGLFSILSIGWSIIKLVGEAFKSLIPAGVGGSVLDLLVRVSKLIQEFDKSLKSTKDTSKGFKDFGKTVDDIFEKIKKFTSSVGSIMEVVGRGVKMIANALAPFVKAIGGAIKDLAGSFNTQDLLNGGLMVALFLAAKKIKGIAGSFEGFIDKIIDSVGGFEEAFGLFGKLGDSLSALTLSVKVGTLVKIATAVGILAVSIKLLAGIPAVDISKALMAITVVLVLLSKSLVSIGAAGVGIKAALTASVVLPALATAILIMAGAMKVMASMDADDLSRGLLGLAGTVTILVTALKIMGKNSGSIAVSSLQLLALATSVVILASAVKKLSEIKSTSLAKAVGALGVILLELAVFLKIVDGSRLSPASGIAVAAVAGSIIIMVVAIERISAIPVKQLVKGLGVIGIILAEIAIFVKLTSGAKTIGAAVSMTIIAGAIQLLIKPLQQLAAMSVKQLIKGLGALGIVLGEVVLAMRFASGGIGGALAITAVAVAINLLVPPLQALGNMSLKQLAKGLGTLAVALGLIAIAANLIGIPGSLALLSLAAAIGALGLAALGVGIGLSAFATALTVLANMTASNVETIMKALGGILKGLIELIPLMVEAIVVFVTEMAKAIVIMAPVLARAGLELLFQLLTIMVEYIPKLAQVGTDVIIALIDAFTENIPRLVDKGVEAVVKLVNGMANGLREHKQEIVDAVLNITEAILETIITALVEVIGVLFGWIPGVKEATKTMGEGATTALRDAFGIKDVGDGKSKEFTGAIDANKALAGTAGENLGIAAKDGAAKTNMTPEGAKAGGLFNTGLGNQSGNIHNTGNSLGIAAKDGAGGVDLSGTGNSAGTAFSSGLGNAAGPTKDAGTNIANKGKEGAGSVDMDDTGKNFGEGFAGGIDSKQDRVNKASTSLGSLAKSALEGFLKIFSPSRVMRKDGGFFGEGFALGIEDEGSNVADKATGLARGAVKAVSNMASQFQSAVEGTLDMAPRIKPVMDMSNMNGVNFNNNIRMPGDLSLNGVGGYGSNITINIQGDNKSPVQIAKEVEKIIVRGIQS